MRILKTLLKIITSLAVLGLIGFFMFAPKIVEKGRNAVAPHDPYPISQAAQALHNSLLIGDWHADSAWWNRDLTERADYGHVDIPRLQEGNVGLQVFTSVTKTPKGMNYEHNDPNAFDNITLLTFGQLWPMRTWFSLYERAEYMSVRMHRFERDAPDDLKIIRTATDLDAVLAARIEGQNLVGAILGLEGAHPLEGDIENLDRLWDSGYRVIALQHFFDNELGGTLHSSAELGLSNFGRQVVVDVENRGMVLDVAHSSQQVVRDVLSMTDMPIIVSHTGLNSHCPTRRNLPDDMMRDIAATGGVIGIGFWANVICDDSPDGVAAAIKAAIAAVGEDHVSLGSDFDGSVKTAFDSSEMAAVTDALLRAGVGEAQITKVMGANMVRVLRARLRD